MCERCDAVLLPRTRFGQLADWLAGRRRDHSWRRGLNVWRGYDWRACWLTEFGDKHGVLVTTPLFGGSLRWYVPERHRRQVIA